MALDRRSFLLRGGLATAGVLGLAQLPLRAAEAEGHGKSAPAHGAGADAELRACRPADPLKALMAGNGRFVRAWEAADRAGTNDERARLLARMWAHYCFTSAHVLKTGQAPWAAIVSCADSRVAPEWVFDAALSDLFVIRSAGNTAFNDAVASLEYAVSHLGVPLVMVMGHSSCGAVKAAMGTEPLTPLLTELVTPIRASLRPGLDVTQAVQSNARAAAVNLTAKSDVLRKARDEGKLSIRSSNYDIPSGRVTLL